MEEGRRAKTREAEVAARRTEQLHNYEQCEMRPPLVERTPQRIRFDWRSTFHAACAACDKEEARHLLLADADADVDCLNIDGLSALHLAAIDNNLDMVEFLIELDADINVEDRESWTPLHATVNCGHNSIARYLIEKGADLAAVNSDGNLPIDIAESDEMKSLIQEAILKQGIDCDSARKSEERNMLRDAKAWALETHSLRQPHLAAGKIDPDTGANALHVAAAKGYTQVMRLLIRCCKVDLDVRDIDGWTPLHSASNWSQKDALELLISSGANVYLKNNKGDSYIDLANEDMAAFIKRVEHEPMAKKNARKMFRGPFDFKPNKTREKEINSKKSRCCGPLCEIARMDEEFAMLEKVDKWADESKKEICVDAGMPDLATGRTLLHTAASKGYLKVVDVLVSKCYLDIDGEDNEGWTPLHFASFYEQNDIITYLITKGASTIIKNKKGDTCTDIANMVVKNLINSLFYKTKGGRRVPLSEDEVEISRKCRELKNKVKLRLATTKTENSIVDNSNEVSEYSSDDSVQSKENTKNTEPKESAEPVTAKDSIPDNNLESPSKLSDNLSASEDEVKRKRSFVPPARDEESATQRKAHAKRIRETRRSTQGISLEEIQNAEMLIRKNSSGPGGTESADRTTEENATGTAAESAMPTNSADTMEGVSETACCVAVTLPLNSSNSTDSNNISTTATISTSGYFSERRPSWRLRLDSGSKFALEDATKNDGDTNKQPPSSANSTEISDSVTIPLRRPSSSDEKSLERLKTPNAKSPDSTPVPKNNIRRRSTGITQIGNLQNEESSKKLVNNEDSAIDYKKLYERSQLEVEKLTKIIKSYEEQFAAKGTLDKSGFQSSAQEINNEKEKREKRALQRKLSEMEEELRSQKALQTENQRLKDENGALIRVIGKLSK